MRRIYFLIPGVDLTRDIIEELKQQGIAHSHLHVVAGIEQPLGDLPKHDVERISDSILKHHPDAHIKVSEPR